MGIYCIFDFAGCLVLNTLTEWFLVLGTVLNILTYGIVFYPSKQSQAKDIIAF